MSFWDDQTQTDVYESYTRYSYLDYSLQKPFSTVEELAAYETRIYLNEVREPAGGGFRVEVDVENISSSTVTFEADATDLDGDNLTYGVSGTDADKVRIDSASGEVRSTNRLTMRISRRMSLR